MRFVNSKYEFRDIKLTIAGTDEDVTSKYIDVSQYRYIPELNAHQVSNFEEISDKLFDVMYSKDTYGLVVSSDPIPGEGRIEFTDKVCTMEGRKKIKKKGWWSRIVA